MATPKTRKADRVHVYFSDGTDALLNPTRPGLMLAFERSEGRAPTDLPSDTLRLCWQSAGSPGDFDSWVESIEDFVQESVEVGKAGS